MSQRITENAMAEAVDEAMNRDMGGEPLTILVGMPAVESIDFRAVANPVDAVVAIPVRYPMVLDTLNDDLEFEGVEIKDAVGLKEWAESQFDYYDIREL